MQNVDSTSKSSYRKTKYNCYPLFDQSMFSTATLLRLSHSSYYIT